MSMLLGLQIVLPVSVFVDFHSSTTTTLHGAWRWPEGQLTVNLDSWLSSCRCQFDDFLRARFTSDKCFLFRFVWPSLHKRNVNLLFVVGNQKQPVNTMTTSKNCDAMDDTDNENEQRGEQQHEDELLDGSQSSESSPKRTFSNQQQSQQVKCKSCGKVARKGTPVLCTPKYLYKSSVPLANDAGPA